MMNTEADAVVSVLGHEALSTLRLALRQASQHDKIGNAQTFAILYHRLGGEADLVGERQAPRP